MKIYIKRNEFVYKKEKYSVEVLKRIEESCDCIDKISHRIYDNEYHDDFDGNNVKINLFLVENIIETESDYDYEENLILHYFEDENLIPINFCPICGDKAEIVLEEINDLSDVIKPLIKEIEEIDRKRSCKTRMNRRYDLCEEIRKIMFS